MPTNFLAPLVMSPLPDQEEEDGVDAEMRLVKRLAQLDRLVDLDDLAERLLVVGIVGRQSSSSRR